MKIVKVRNIPNGKYDRVKEYLFQTTHNLKKGDIVHCETVAKNGMVGVVTADSIEIRKEVLDFLEFDAPWKQPLKNVIGKMEYWEAFEKGVKK